MGRVAAAGGIRRLLSIERMRITPVQPRALYPRAGRTTAVGAAGGTEPDNRGLLLTRAVDWANRRGGAGARKPSDDDARRDCLFSAGSWLPQIGSDACRDSTRTYALPYTIDRRTPVHVRWSARRHNVADAGAGPDYGDCSARFWHGASGWPSATRHRGRAGVPASSSNVGDDALNVIRRHLHLHVFLGGRRCCPPVRAAGPSPVPPRSV